MGPRGGQQNSNAPSTSWADEVSSLDTEQHVPVGGFNAAEAKAALRRGEYDCHCWVLMLTILSLGPGGMEISTPNRIGKSLIRAPAPRSYFYKSPGKDATNRAAGPWGSKRMPTALEAATYKH